MLGFLIPTWGEMRHMQDAMPFGAGELGSGPIEEEASGAADANGEAQEAQADPATRPLIRQRPEEHAHCAEDIQPHEKRAACGIFRGKHTDDSGRLHSSPAINTK